MTFDEKLNESPTAEAVDMLDVTPVLLQRYATQLELAAREALPGQVVTMKISRNRTLRYRVNPLEKKHINLTGSSTFESSRSMSETETL